jgi:predicted RNA-binding protein Jag
MAKGSVYEGKTFEEAVRKGLDELRLSRAEATITMIEEGKGGFLGFGARPFRVSIARRPGGAVREPEETRERRVSSTRRDDRRGGRGGRDRDRDRGRDRDKGGDKDKDRDKDRDKDKGGDKDKDREVVAGPRRRDENRRDEPRREDGRRGQQPARAEGAREERPARAEGRGDGRGESREGREVRGEGREGRGEGREGRRDGRREERRPAVSEAGAAAPAAGAAPADAGQESGAEALERRRRRRGRRGGRGRRREGAPGMPQEAGAVSSNGVTHEEGSFEAHEEFESHREFETGDAPVEARVEPHHEPRPEPRPEAAPRRAESPVAVETMEEPAMASSELAEQSRHLTEELLRAMGFEATVTATADGNRADVTAEIARDEELLNGQKGEVRQALQHLLNRFVNRGDGSRYHLQLEINDFWARREKELEELARSFAEQAVSGNTELVTDYLNSQERRIVHVTLKEDTRVRTFALGTGMIKRVAIAPASFPERTGEEDAG